MQPHTEQLHITKLHELCRTCGRRSLSQKDKKKKRKPKKCEEIKQQIFRLFDVELSKDKYTSHSSTICMLCARKLTHFGNETSTNGLIQNARTNAKSIQHIWIPFKDNIRTVDCSTCSHYAITADGNRYQHKKTPDGTKSVLGGKFELLSAILLLSYYFILLNYPYSIRQAQC